jgi:SAM-dependent methyltransferase
MDSTQWDARYSGAEPVWSLDANRWVVQELSAASPGRALDVATGEGRNAIWLAARGWSVTAVDFSQAGLNRAAELAARAGEGRAPLDITWLCHDVRVLTPTVEGYDLVLVSYLHVPAHERTPIVRTGARALAPGGVLLVVGHDTTNLAEGVGGPQDPRVLFTAADLEADLQDQIRSGALRVERSTRAAREVETEDGPRHAWDAVFKARRWDFGKTPALGEGP